MTRPDGGPAFPVDMDQCHRMAIEEVAGIPQAEREKAYIAAFNRIACGVTVRDYFIAHAPSEPQPWFTPQMEGERPTLPPPPDRRALDEEWLRELEYATRFADHINPEELKSPKLSAWIGARSVAKKLIYKFDAMAQRERYVQWPAAWADAMLAERSKP